MIDISFLNRKLKIENNMTRLALLLERTHSHVHLIGVCGVGMAGLAYHLRRRGFRVTGCDAVRGARADWLEQQGVPVAAGHDPAHVAGAKWVVRSTAVPAEHPEIRAARAAGLPVFQRGVVLAALVAGETAIAVSGTHGKTTTTAMIIQVLRAAGLDPAFCIGGESAGLGGVAGGAGRPWVVEADESDGTLTRYQPDVAVITTIEFEHAEHFKNLAAVRQCFAAFADHARKRVIFCADDPEAGVLGQDRPKAVSYGINQPADFQAVGVQVTSAGASFHLQVRGADQGLLSLPVPGRHNVLNALAACAVAAEWNLPFAVLQRALRAFEPVKRRFEQIVARDDVRVVSDYAHHPTEIAAVLQVVRQIPRARWRVVFQPHRYSRTRALGPDFARVFSDLDELVLAPVYAASELPLSGGTHANLYAQVRATRAVPVRYAASLDQIQDYLRATLRAGDGLLILGAGDIVRLANWASVALAAQSVGELNPAPGWAADLPALGLTNTRVRTNASLARRTTLHVGGEADIFLDVGCEDDLVRITKWTHDRQIHLAVLGAGSNVLASDLGVRGVVLRLAGPGFRARRVAETDSIVAGAGLPLTALVSRLAEQGRSGLEFLHGIPGTLGGALRMNAGAWGESIGPRVLWVRALNPDGSVIRLEPPQLDFAYRQCPALNGRLVLAAALRVTAGRRAEIRKKMREIAARRAWMQGLRSAGSVFRNPPGDSAGRLLEAAGLKGRRVGGARVCERHANVIIAETGATASDVAALMAIMRQEVAARWAVTLATEMVTLE